MQEPIEAGSHFVRKNGRLHCEELPLADLAERFGTPCYVYSAGALRGEYLRFDALFAAREHLICYAVKANPALAILNLLARMGAGFDIVSGGELNRVMAAGGDPSKVVFSGVGKSEGEIRMALEAGVLSFNIESESELGRIERIAAHMQRRAPISLRVNPDVDARTHPYIATGLRDNKFGIPYADAMRLYAQAAALPHLTVVGVDCHIGSQLTDIAPFAEALDKVLFLVEGLKGHGIGISHVDLGGGLGIRYGSETPPDLDAYARMILERMRGYPHKLILEPGRCLVGNAGVLLTRVEYLKHGEHRNFAVVDAAMNDLMRPALYGAYHVIAPVEDAGTVAQRYDVVGPVCESGDFLGRDRMLSLREGDLLAVMSVGAYGMSMSSNYNSRPRPPEVMVEGRKAYLTRRREQVEALYDLETTLP
jgi:diaminopimelate decarboxylase